MRLVRPPAARRPLALLLFAALAPAALAQHFAFVSTRVPDDLAGAYGRPPQSEVFLYRDGSEIRLTSTPHASEYDPRRRPAAATSPSPLSTTPTRRRATGPGA